MHTSTAKEDTVSLMCQKKNKKVSRRGRKALRHELANLRGELGFEFMKKQRIKERPTDSVVFMFWAKIKKYGRTRYEVRLRSINQEPKNKYQFEIEEKKVEMSAPSLLIFLEHITES